MSRKWRKRFDRVFAQAVVAEAERQRLDGPISYRTLTINFENRSFGFDGAMIPVETAMVSIPILSTDRLVFPR